MGRGAALLGLVLCALPVRADEVTFPLTIDYQILGRAVRDALEANREGEAVLWGTRGGCRSLVLRDMAIDPAEGRTRFVARGTGRLGFGFLGFCFAPLSWDGYVDSLATPEIGRDWQLRFRDLDSHLYDAERRPTVVASRLWELVKARIEDRLEAFHLDLAPPIDEAAALIRASTPPEHAEPVLAALRTFRPRGVTADADGVKVQVAVDLPPPAPVIPVPEAPLSPEELQRWQAAVESWDAFLVFVIKDLGLAGRDPAVRAELFDLLLTSRHEMLAALAREPRPGVDPVRQLFLQTWDRLHDVVRRAALRGGLQGRALRYATFLAAGDALAAVDAAGPSLGLEISADGLRRLARLLDPEYAGDPLGYSEEPDSALRELFDFHEPNASPAGEREPGAPPSAWWWPGPGAAHAAEPPPDATLATLVRRLDRWVPDDHELPSYRDAMNRLLDHVTAVAHDRNVLDARVADMFPHLVKAVAWQESCWRQFVRRNGKITYLVSSTGDIGLMQVNRRVWRGFFDLRKLQWDIAYNGGAGAEILAQLLMRYGLKEADAGPDNAARATYAAYNGGPSAYRRYRLAHVPRVQRAIDQAFWEKYRAVVAGQALDFVLCVERWGRPPTTQLSTAPPGSTPRCCISSRSCRATSAIPSPHFSIASRPRASFV